MLIPSEGSENQTAYKKSAYFYRDRSTAGQKRAFQTNGKLPKELIWVNNSICHPWDFFMDRGYSSDFPAVWKATG